MKIIKLFIVFLCFTIILCGCSSKSSKITIQFASWGSKSEIDILKPIIKEFENKNPDIRVDFMHIPQNYFQKIHLLFASNTPPDVIFINNLYLPIYANAGLLEELEIPTGYYKQAIDAFTYQDKLYAIPRDVSNLVIFYNKDLFNKKNVKYPDCDWNFNKFLETVKKLTDDNTFGINFEEEPMFYLPYLMSNGGGILPEEIAKKESKDALNFYSDLRNKYHVAPKKHESASATSAQMFLQGRLGMYISGRWMVPKLREEANFDWDITQFPKGTKGSIVPLDASGWAISKQSKHKKEALKFINFLASDKNLIKFAKSGLIVPAKIETSKTIIDNKLPKNSLIFLKIIETSKPTPVTTNYREITDKLKKDLEGEFNR